MINTNTHRGPSFSYKNKSARLLWRLIEIILFRPSPTPLHQWRSFLLKLFGAKVGLGVHVYPYVKIWAPWNLVLGDECGIANDVFLYSQALITIGKQSVISQGSYLATGTHDYTKPGFRLVTRPINIGDNVWIAAQSFIHPGVTVGDGCIIGARSVVIKNMPKWMVCSGNPCNVIKRRDFNL